MKADSLKFAPASKKSAPAGGWKKRREKSREAATFLVKWDVASGKRPVPPAGCAEKWVCRCRKKTGCLCGKPVGAGRRKVLEGRQLFPSMRAFGRGACAERL
ncbi:hypothetical protein A5N82_03420 [Christensenella minuta]|uniref:Uncharacterized protein n=1 Tax=Christensenella minuta TaxID=626937 RepID=A0A136Q5Q4_9FIRM|nr:hypothetical protein B1H56_06525 [Christensenella minuta]KXK65980.1 hypothetical protein HMPREF3293_01272 [Christensenella minuta]OAQ43417.1 hypothetical protein A5N82_03420 [Christensenella minuta]